MSADAVYQDNPDLSRKFQEGEAGRVGDAAEDRTTAARLFRRDPGTMMITVPDEGGDIKIRVKILTAADMDHLANLRGDLAVGTRTHPGMTQAEIQEAGREWAAERKEFAEKLAEICLDESLTPEFFMSPDLPMELPYRIFDEILIETGRRINAIRSFRAPSPGSE